MKTVLISHIDLDGLGSIILTLANNNLIGNNIKVDEIYSWNNNYENFELLKKFDNIIITDLSLKKETIEKLVKLNKNLCILDHHETANYLNSFSNCCCDTFKCGTMLFYEKLIFKKTKISDQFVKIIDLYDRWVEDNPQFEFGLNLNRLFDALVVKKDIAQTNIIYRNNNLNKTNPFIDFINIFCKKLKTQENLIFSKLEQDDIERQKKYDDRCVKLCEDTLQTRKDSRNIIYGVIILSKGSVSYICHELLKKYKDLIYIIVKFSFKDDRLSVRSRKNFDITKLTNFYGHKNSGGGEFDKSFVKSFISDSSVHIPYK